MSIPVEIIVEKGDWCPRRDWVKDNKRFYRCSGCNKRLWPIAFDANHNYISFGPKEIIGYRLPYHKAKRRFNNLKRKERR